MSVYTQADKGMKTFILMIGLLVSDVAYPIPEISGAAFGSLQECESVKNNRAVWESYAESLGPGMVLWCVEVEQVNPDLRRAAVAEAAAELPD